MEDLPTSLLTQQEQSRPRSGEELETFGKYAAKLYLGGVQKTLSGAVVETVKSASLSPEQVRRVVEFTNTAAYLEKFASEGSGHKVINFDGGPASFPDVIRDLNDGSGGSLTDPVRTSDYSLPPPDVDKLASKNLLRLGLTDAKLAEAFNVTEVPYAYENPLRDSMDMRDKIASVYDEATSELTGLETRYHDLCDLLFHQVKQASLNGVPLGHVVAVLSTVTDEPAFIKSAFDVLTPRLIQNEVFSSPLKVAESLEKYAGAGLVNPNHPMVGIFEDYCDTLAKLAGTRQAREELVSQLDILNTFINKAAGVASSVRTVAAQVPKAWRTATSLADRASKPVTDFVTELGLPNAAPFVGGAVKYAPHIGAGLLAEDVYQRLQANPLAQGAKNFVMSRIPYTQQHLMRQYQLSQGF